MPRIEVPGTGGSSAVAGSVARVHGLVGQTFDLGAVAVGAASFTGGQRQYVTVPVERAATIDELYVEVGTAGVDGAALLANCFVGVHLPDGTLIGTSADQTASWKSLGVKAIAITVVGGQSLAVDPATTPHVFAQILIGTQSSTAVALMRTSNITGRCNYGLTLPAFAYATASGALSALDTGVPGMTVPGTGTMTLGSNAWYVGVGATT